MALSSAAHAEGIYVTGSIGRSDAAVEPGVYGARFRDVTGDDSSYSVGVGYDIGRIFSVEATYHDLGQFTGSRNRCAFPACTAIAYLPESVDSSALVVSATAGHTITDRLYGYGRAGLADWRLDSASGVYDETGLDLSIGAGLRWSASQRFSVFAEYMRLDFDVDAVTVGLRFNAGRRE